MVENAEQQRKRDLEERERLKREILDQAAKAREEKKKPYDQDEKDAKKLAMSKKEQELMSVYGKTDDKTQNKPKKKKKKAKKDSEKTLSKVLDNKENGSPKLERTLTRGRNNAVQEQDRAQSADIGQNQTRAALENQQKLLDKHKKMLAQLSEKKKLELQLEEEANQRQERIREKLKEKVLNMAKTTTALEFHALKKESPTATTTIKGLNLADSTEAKKPKTKVTGKSLPPIKNVKKKRTEEDDEKDNYDGDANDDSASEDDEGKPKTKVSKDKSKKGQLPIFPNIQDLEQWKKKHRLDPNTKVFVVLGGYGALKRALLERGWVENPDRYSPCFDLKWTLKAKDINRDALLDFQIVNHFEKNTTITTKAGLCKSLRNLVWHANVDYETFYPKCYDMSDPNDLEDFIEDFKNLKAQSILKKYLKAVEKKDSAIKDMETQVRVALNVCQRGLRDTDELLEDPRGITPQVVTAEEWAILGTDELTEEGLALKKHENWMKALGNNPNLDPKTAPPKKKKKKTKKKIDGEEQKDEGNDDDEEEENPFENELTQEVRSVLAALCEKHPQFDLNGHENIYIVKPAGLSRGRGITCLKSLVEILDYTKHAGQWVVQKYMENPLIIKRRKFDIRQWVLVTDWNPLTVWFYEECYVRFSAGDYDTSKLDNKFIHLTNNSVTKHNKEDANEEIEGNMWTCQAFEDHLKSLDPNGGNIFQEKIKPSMKKTVVWSLESVQDMIENKKNSVELYGYDFMVDENFNVWLIEINSSPAMDYSTAVTERLVKMVLEDTVKVLVDYGMSKKKKKKDIDTGLFTLIHKSKQIVDKPLTSFGLDLKIEGKSAYRAK